MKKVGIALEKLASEPLQGMVVHAGIGIEKVKVDVDQALLRTLSEGNGCWWAGRDLRRRSQSQSPHFSCPVSVWTS